MPDDRYERLLKRPRIDKAKQKKILSKQTMKLNDTRKANMSMIEKGQFL